MQFSVMSQACFFGYGSLVNRTTHHFGNTHPAKATGWRRAWRATSLRPVCFLTAVPDQMSEIDGLIARVPDDDWEALDAREYAYTRVPAAAQITHDLPEQPSSIALYAIDAGQHFAPGEDNPVLLSYLDVVIQGYLDVFAAKGAERFFETTSGWSAPILNDRAVPRYPRAQHVSSEAVACVDEALAKLGARIIDGS